MSHKKLIQDKLEQKYPKLTIFKQWNDSNWEIVDANYKPENTQKGEKSIRHTR